MLFLVIFTEKRRNFKYEILLTLKMLNEISILVDN